MLLLIDIRCLCRCMSLMVLRCRRRCVCWWITTVLTPSAAADVGLVLWFLRFSVLYMMLGMCLTHHRHFHTSLLRYYYCRCSGSCLVVLR
ncbi:hypothetical protein HanIR_Chr11g0510831 [Helianthus annuus]|nr:hypothetical protein HanIR_Chr11g0510821 [Helianthus annuus]KAJ0507856.1 hypothetical protein HanIR_Chr11g0510831 [Helianthus annuus]